MIRYNNNWFSSRCALNELAMYDRIREREREKKSREYNPDAKTILFALHYYTHVRATERSHHL